MKTNLLSVPVDHDLPIFETQDAMDQLPGNIIPFPGIKNRPDSEANGLLVTSAIGIGQRTPDWEGISFLAMELTSAATVAIALLRAAW